jgi:hypothetical protein
MKRCPYYQGVCGLDESYVCYCSSTYFSCENYKRNKTQKSLAEVVADALSDVFGNEATISVETKET